MILKFVAQFADGHFCTRQMHTNNVAEDGIKIWKDVVIDHKVRCVCCKQWNDMPLQHPSPFCLDDNEVFVKAISNDKCLKCRLAEISSFCSHALDQLWPMDHIDHSTVLDKKDLLCAESDCAQLMSDSLLMSTAEALLLINA